MTLRPEQARVVAALIEKEATVPDSYPMTLNALRSACNQTTNRNPVVSYDDRTVEDALVSLKAMGLVRFVHPSHGGRTTRYRHVADEHWELERGELLVLAFLALRGPQTAAELRSRVGRLLPGDASSTDELLDALSARRPAPLATRLERRAGEREPRYADLLCGEPADDDAGFAQPPGRADDDGPQDPPNDQLATLASEVSELRRRLEHLERSLGVEPPR